MNQYIIFGNYGNQTLAVIQWAHENRLHNVTIASIDTGWQAEGWSARVEQAENFVKHCGFNVVRLKSKLLFPELMLDRGNFPSTKFQWCAGFLKGLPLLDWLDVHDAAAEAVIILGKRRLDSRLNFDLPEYIDSSEHYGDRKIWYPLFQDSDDAYQTLLQNSGLPILTGRSLECDPCVNSFGNDLARLQDGDIIKTRRLEEKVGHAMFSMPVEEMVRQARSPCSPERQAASGKTAKTIFDMGCGAPWACGE